MQGDHELGRRHLLQYRRERVPDEVSRIAFAKHRHDLGYLLFDIGLQVSQRLVVSEKRATHLV